MPIDQGTILRKIQAYIELKYRNNSETRAEISKLFAAGHCSGLSGVYLYRKKRGQESQFFGNLALISQWDETEESLELGDRFLEKAFEQFINDLRWVHLESTKLMLSGVKQKDLVDIFESTKPTAKTTALAEEFSMTFVCKNNDEFRTILENAVAKNTDKLIFFSGNSIYGKGHTVAIMPKKKVVAGKAVYRYCLYDPNNPKGETILPDLDALQRVLKRNLFEVFKYNENIYQKKTRNQEEARYMPVSIQIFDEADKANPHRYNKSSTEISAAFLKQDVDLTRILYTLVNAIKYDDMEQFYFIISNTDININGKTLKESINQLEDLFNKIYGKTILAFAAEMGSWRVLSYLLSEPLPIQAKLNSEDFFKRTELQLAVNNDYFQCALLLLQNKKVNVNHQDYQKNTALHIAVQNGNLAMVNLLLRRKGINVNLQNSNGDTPLTLAIKNKDMDIIRSILKDKHLNLLSHNVTPTKLLHLAFKTGRIEIIKVILENIPKKEQLTALLTEDENGKSAIFYAIESPVAKLRKFIFERIPVELLQSKNSKGITPLMHGINHLLETQAEASNESIDELLFSPKADLRATYPNGETLYTSALKAGNSFVANLIIEAYKKRGEYTKNLQAQFEAEKERIELAEFNKDKSLLESSSVDALEGMEGFEEIGIEELEGGIDSYGIPEPLPKLSMDPEKTEVEKTTSLKTDGAIPGSDNKKEFIPGFTKTKIVKSSLAADNGPSSDASQAVNDNQTKPQTPQKK